jgi:hypothetical protein
VVVVEVLTFEEGARFRTTPNFDGVPIIGKYVLAVGYGFMVASVVCGGCRKTV